MSKKFSVKIILEETNEIFEINDVTSQTKIEVLKNRLELIAGIPKPMQCLMYLDRGQMENYSSLQHHDVVPGGQLTMSVWQAWKALVKACVKGSLTEVLSLGVTKNSSYRDAATNYMKNSASENFFLARAGVALYIAAHRGHFHIIKKLIEEGTDYATTTLCGRTALHVAAAQGKDKCIDLLLANGSGSVIHKEDQFGATPLQLAGTCGHKSSERRLFLFQWQERASKMKLLRAETSLMAHQMFDSTLPTHMKGTFSQMYCTNILPPEEFQGGALGAKRSDSKNILNAKRSSLSKLKAEGKKSESLQQSALKKSKKNLSVVKLPNSVHRTAKVKS